MTSKQDKEPKTPRICLVLTSTEQGNNKVCRKTNCKHHNGFAWFCEEHWNMYYAIKNNDS